MVSSIPPVSLSTTSPAPKELGDIQNNISYPNEFTVPLTHGDSEPWARVPVVRFERSSYRSLHPVATYPFARIKTETAEAGLSSVMELAEACSCVG